MPYFADIAVDELGQIPTIFPTPESEAGTLPSENRAICVTCHSQTPFVVQMANCTPAMDVGGRPTQCFPFYSYSKDGSKRQENMTDWALEQFRAHYSQPTLSKWEIFYYVYALLHHPTYRETYAANLKRELPRIPLTFMPSHRPGKSWQTCTSITKSKQNTL